MLLLVVFFLAAQSAFVKDLLSRYYAPALTYIASKVLMVAGVSHRVIETAVTAGGATFSVSYSCTGIFVFLLLCAAMLSFPVSFKSRLQGIAAGFAVIFLLNTLRIVIIVMAGGRFSDTFWFLHIIAGQILIIAGTAAFFIFWLNFMTSGHFLSDMLSRQNAFKTVLLFTAGYAAGLLFYDLFLQSGFGEQIKDLVREHAVVVIRLVHTALPSSASAGPSPQILFNTGCLSSPVIVVLIGLILCMPWHWTTRAILLVIGFVPAFYGYHLVRAVVTDLSFTLGKTRGTSVIYNCWGQFFLAGLGILLFRYHAYKKGKTEIFLSPAGALTGLAAGGAAASAGGFVFVHWLLPAITSVLTPGGTDFYNAQLTISTMPYLQFFILFFLVWSGAKPTLTKLQHSGVGSGLLLAFMVFITGTIELFGLSPHIGSLKFGIILFPLLICVFME